MITINEKIARTKGAIENLESRVQASEQRQEAGVLALIQLNEYDDAEAIAAIQWMLKDERSYCSVIEQKITQLYNRLNREEAERAGVA
jgi:lipopolysaccharide biosynthesis regulator YciM